MDSSKFDTLSTFGCSIILSNDDFDRFVTSCDTANSPNASLVDALLYSRRASLVLSQPPLIEDGSTGIPVGSSLFKGGQQAKRVSSLAPAIAQQAPID